MSTGTCGRKESTEEICSSASTTLQPTSSEYGTAEAAVAHLTTVFGPSSTLPQDAWGYAGTTTKFREGGLSSSNNVAMYGRMGYHMIPLKYEVLAVRNITSAIPRRPPCSRSIA